MRRSSIVWNLGASLIAVPALAQAPSPSPAPSATTPPTAQAPVSGQPSDTNLTVASVKMEGGLRASKIIGSPVYNDQKEKIGSIDDLIVKNDNQIVMAIVSVGGFLGIGNKLVAIPYNQLHVDLHNNETPVVLAGANKDSLNAMATFTYNG